MLKKLLTLLFILAALPLFAASKSRSPYIGYAYPSGVQQGKEKLVIIGGMNLRGLKEATFSGEGVTVTSIKPFRPFKRFSNDLRRELMPILKAIDEGKDPIAESRKHSEKLIRKLKKQQADEDAAKKKAEAEARRKGLPIEKPTGPPQEKAYQKELQITPGERLIYVDMTPEEVVKMIKEMSPLEYQIMLKEVFKRRNALQAAPAIEQIAIMEVKVDQDAKPGFRELRVKSKEGISNHIPFVIGTMPEITTKTFRMDRKNPPQDLQLAKITNGQIMPGEVDKYHFKAQKGRNYSFELQGRSLVPFLSDAVPGWFQPIMSIHDKTGKQVAFADDNLFNPDPVIAFKAPANEEYELRIRDSIYRGREDFVYRLKAKQGQPGKWKIKNLALKGKLPRKSESEPNDKVQSPQRIIYPTLIAGNFHKPGDVDVYRFMGQKGQKLAVEVFARRIDSPVDSLLKITDENGKTLAWNDDYEWLNFGTKTHHADSYLLFEVPENGNYFIKVMETQVKGGKGFDYLLRVDKPKPDFEVFMTPSAINTRTTVSSPINLIVFRKDGFKGPIDILLKKAPKGSRLTGNRKIPEGVDKIQMTIGTDPKSRPGLHDIILAAKAEVNGKTIFHNVIPTDRIMQAFLWTHLVPTKERAILNITRRGWLPVKPEMPKGITKIAPGEKIEFKLYDYQFKKRANAKLKKKKNADIDEILFELVSAPKGLKLTKSGYENKHFLMTLEADKDTKPWQGNLIIECSAKGTWRKNGKSGTYNHVIGALPAVPVQVVKK